MVCLIFNTKPHNSTYPLFFSPFLPIMPGWTKHPTPKNCIKGGGWGLGVACSPVMVLCLSSSSLPRLCRFFLGCFCGFPCLKLHLSFFMIFCFFFSLFFSFVFSVFLPDYWFLICFRFSHLISFHLFIIFLMFSLFSSHYLLHFVCSCFFLFGLPFHY